MDLSEYRFEIKDLEKIDQEVRKIIKACESLSVFSKAKGGIPAIDRNLVRIAASLKNLTCTGEILEMIRKNGKEPNKDK